MRAIALSSTALLTLLVIGSACAAEPKLFREVEVGEAPRAAQLLGNKESRLTHERLVRLNPLIGHAPDGPKVGQSFIVNLGWGVPDFRAAVVEIAPSKDSERMGQWIASGDNEERVTAIVDDKGITAILEAAGRRFHIYPTPAAGVNRLVEYDPAGARDHRDEAQPPPLTEDQKKLMPTFKGLCDEARETSVGKESRPTIMILWTPAAEKSLRSRGYSIDAEVQKIVNTMIQAMRGDRFSVKPELVHRQRISYAEKSRHLERELKSLTDGKIRGVWALRERYKADLVMLLGNYPDGNACGFAYTLDEMAPAQAPFAFSVVDVSEICEPLDATAAHEVGHNFGMKHDRTGEGHSATGYNFGYIDFGHKLRTLMAVNKTCEAKRFDCRQVMRFSTPREKFPNDGPMGVPADKPRAAHNMEALCQNAPVVEGFRH